MGLNAHPPADRVHIGIFGLRNAGKSSMVNRVTGQTLSIVSDVKGTTTDPVQKAMELLPFGPVVIIDTPGLMMTGTLVRTVSAGIPRLEKTDIAVLVTDSTPVCSLPTRGYRADFEKGNPLCSWLNKSDLTSAPTAMPAPNRFTSAQHRYRREYP